MKKKILCVIVSAVMVLGTLVGCGSSSSNPSSDTVDKDNDKSSKVEQTILTELIPGETTAEETKKWFQDNALVTETDGYWGAYFTDNGIPSSSKSSDTFLGYKCFYTLFDYVGSLGSKKDYETGLEDKTLKGYTIFVTFTDRDDFKAGKEKIEEYVNSLSDTKATNEYINSDTSILIKDKDKYATRVDIKITDLETASYNDCDGLTTGDYYDTVLAVTYVVNDFPFVDWILPDGTKFDLKCKDFVQSNQ